jgi:hypothetical protein
MVASSVARSAAMAQPPAPTRPPTCAHTTAVRSVAWLENNDAHCATTGSSGPSMSLVPEEHQQVAGRRQPDRGERDRAMCLLL